ncbi:MAG: PD-(D/E)XK nuclease family protein [Bryobacteraceae bacterium]|nr:PD-(D/E)XK nuclease family protein [Bryobacteraceae bacterium]
MLWRREYTERYPTEELEIVALEKTFEGPIGNSATGAASRSVVLAGKVDGIVRVGDEYFVLEHKTASQMDADYLEKLWSDFQITLYAHYIEQTLGIPEFFCFSRQAACHFVQAYLLAAHKRWSE